MPIAKITKEFIQTVVNDIERMRLGLSAPMNFFNLKYPVLAGNTPEGRHGLQNSDR